METRERMEAELNCPICLNLPSSTPIYQCQEGHLVCKDCHAKVNSCSICRSTPLGSIRSLMAEKMLTESKFKCKFTDFGCELEDNLTNLIKHEEHCDHETIKCTFKVNGCDAESKRFIIKNHEFECSYQTIECRYKIDGCEVKSTLKYLIEHEGKCDFRLVPCKFEEYGCTEKWSMIFISNHELECEFQIVKCQLAVNGCEFKSGKNEMVKHESECEFWITSCKFKNQGCKFTCISKNIEKHQNFYCDFRVINCKYKSDGCELRDIFTRTMKHQKNCPERILVCKYEKCYFEIAAKFMGKHQENCSEQIINCLNEKCSFKSNLKAMKEHEKVCQHRIKECKWSKNGCTFKRPLIEHLDHANECSFKQTLKCSVLGINFSIQDFCNTDEIEGSDQITKHLQMFHEHTFHELQKTLPHTESVQILEENGQIMKEVDFPTLFLVKKSISVHGFLAKLKLRRDGSLSGGIYYAGKINQESENYEILYNISIKKASHSVTYTGSIPIYNDDKQYQYAIFIPPFQLRNLVDENGRVKITFEVTKLKERKRVQKWWRNSNESFDSEEGRENSAKKRKIS